MTVERVHLFSSVALGKDSHIDRPLENGSAMNVAVGRDVRLAFCGYKFIGRIDDEAAP